MEKDGKSSRREYSDVKKQQKRERAGWKPKSQRKLLNIITNRLKNVGRKHGRKSADNVCIPHYLILDLFTFATIFITQKHFRIILNLSGEDNVFLA